MPRNKYGFLETRSKKPWDQDYGEDWEEQRERALRRDGYRCLKCGKSVKGTSRRAVHHIIELSKGGTNRLSNLATECSDCHELEHPHLKKAREAREKSKPVKAYPTKAGFFDIAGTPSVRSQKDKNKSYYAKKSRSLF